MFNKKIHMSLVASALAGSFALAGSAVAADLKDLHQANAQIQRAAVQSQEKINTIYEQTQELLGEYRQVVDQTDNLKVYNDFLATLVADQQRQINSFQRQIDGLEKTNQGTVPLMFRMIDGLEQFIKADIPLRTERRLERVQRLRDLMARSDVQRSEQFRQILEAYEIEMSYGTELASFQGTLSVDGSEVTVDYVHIGRLALMALALDGASAWVYNKNSGSWVKLPDSYLTSVSNYIKMARREATLDMDRVPLFAAE
jgi:HPt (histidine-containing phosphotransfer) domain-containing protein